MFCRFKVNCWVILAISNEDRTQAFNEQHPDRRKVFDQIAFAFHLERKQDDVLPMKKSMPLLKQSTKEPHVRIVEDENKTQE